MTNTSHYSMTNTSHYSMTNTSHYSMTNTPHYSMTNTPHYSMTNTPHHFMFPTWTNYKIPINTITCIDIHYFWWFIVMVMLRNDWLSEWRFYTLSVSEAIFRARTYSHITYTVCWWWILMNGTRRKPTSGTRVELSWVGVLRPVGI